MLKKIFITLFSLISIPCFAGTVTVETGGSNCPMYVQISDTFNNNVRNMINICQAESFIYNDPFVEVNIGSKSYNIKKDYFDDIMYAILPKPSIDDDQ